MPYSDFGNVKASFSMGTRGSYYMSSNDPSKALGTKIQSNIKFKRNKGYGASFNDSQGKYWLKTSQNQSISKPSECASAILKSRNHSRDRPISAIHLPLQQSMSKTIRTYNQSPKFINLQETKKQMSLLVGSYFK